MYVFEIKLKGATSASSKPSLLLAVVNKSAADNQSKCSLLEKVNNILTVSVIVVNVLPCYNITLFQMNDIFVPRLEHGISCPCVT